MIVIPSKDFDKSVKKINDKIARKRLDELIQKLKRANSLREINNVVSIVNHPFLYRIRTGDYRLVVEYIDGAITILLIQYSKRDDNTYRNYK